MKKSELLHWLQEEKQQWEALLAQIGGARMDQAGVAAHLTSWTQWQVARIQAAPRGEPEPPPPWPTHLQTDDDINAGIYEANRGRSTNHSTSCSSSSLPLQA